MRYLDLLQQVKERTAIFALATAREQTMANASVKHDRFIIVLALFHFFI